MDNPNFSTLIFETIKSTPVVEFETDTQVDTYIQSHKDSPMQSDPPIKREMITGTS